MESKSYQYYKELPSWAKGVVVIGVLGVTYLFANQIIKKIKEDAAKKSAEENLNQSRSELQQQQQNGVPATFSKSQYDAMATEIADEFEGCDTSGLNFGVILEYLDLSTSAKKVYDIVGKLNNNRDFLELIDSFGVRTWDACGVWNGNVENKTLYQGVTNELNGGEIKFINNYLKQRGITYQF
jgi:hypothetical protein